MRIVRRIVHRLCRARLAPQPPNAKGTTFHIPEVHNWYSPVQLTAATVGRLATDPATLQEVNRVVQLLSPDPYLTFVKAYCETAQARFGNAWEFADILTTLWAAAHLAMPESYLEIGVRRGRSMAIVASAMPECNIVGFDLWQQPYVGMDNPGPDFVRDQLRAVGHRGSVNLISGDSHATVKQYFGAHPDQYFDLITVDGDHTRQGAIQDLRDVIPRLKLGGILVFDDLTLAEHPHLDGVWKREVVNRPQFQTWSFREIGYGVGVAIRVLR